MSYRSCDTCTACCEGWLKAEKLDMAPGRPCRHCSEQGCAIYKDRPQDPCVTFECAWLQPDGRLPKRMRPDRSGVIVVLGRVRLGHEVIFALPVGQAIPKPMLDWMEKYAKRENKPLISFEHQLIAGEFTETTATGFGPPEFVQRVRNEIRSEDVLVTKAPQSGG